MAEVIEGEDGSIGLILTRQEALVVYGVMGELQCGGAIRKNADKVYHTLRNTLGANTVGKYIHQCIKADDISEIPLIEEE